MAYTDSPAASGVSYDLTHLDVLDRDRVSNHRWNPLAHGLGGVLRLKTTMLTPESSARVQYPATNPGACDTPGTTCSRKWLVEASRSLTVTVTTTACTGTSFVAGGSSRGPYPAVDAKAGHFSPDIANAVSAGYAVGANPERLAFRPPV
jgi:hypothetical protein